MLQFFQERKASNIDGYFKLLNPHSGKFLTVVNPQETKIEASQTELPQLPEQAAQTAQTEEPMESDEEQNISFEFDSLTL
jgi:hypothetical protein